MPGIPIDDKTVELPFHDLSYIIHKARKIKPESYEKVKQEL